MADKLENGGGNQSKHSAEQTAKSGEQQTFSIQCDEISKRTFGMAIVKFCGHEGTENDQNKKVLRRLLQAAISHVELETAATWRNTEVKIYDDNFDVYSIKAGKHEHRVFMVSMDEKDEPKVVKTKHERVNAGARRDHFCSLL